MVTLFSYRFQLASTCWKPKPWNQKRDGVSQNGGLKVHLISNMNPEYDHIISFPSISYGSTPPKINIEPENYGLEDDFAFPGVYSQVPC